MGGKERKPTIRVAWRGPSLIDGSPIRVVVYCLRHGSKSRKLGPVAQVLICPDDVPPHVAVKNGRDFAVCGQCLLRPMNGGGCYCNLGAYFPRVFETSTQLPADINAVCKAIRESGLPLRIGSWGDPAAVPPEVIERLVDAARGPNGEPRHTAYTECGTRLELKGIAMRSVLSVQDQREAESEGWRTFRVRGPEDPVLPGEVVCPASAEAGHKTTCSQCLLCSGGGRKGPNVTIRAHGPAWKVKAVERVLKRS